MSVMKCHVTSMRSCVCRILTAAAEAKLKAELKSTYLTQLDRKRLTLCKQELVGNDGIHGEKEKENTSLNINVCVCVCVCCRRV